MSSGFRRSRMVPEANRSRARASPQHASMRAVSGSVSGISARRPGNGTGLSMFLPRSQGVPGNRNATRHDRVQLRGRHLPGCRGSSPHDRCQRAQICNRKTGTVLVISFEICGLNSAASHQRSVKRSWADGILNPTGPSIVRTHGESFTSDAEYIEYIVETDSLSEGLRQVVYFTLERRLDPPGSNCDRRA